MNTINANDLTLDNLWLDEDLDCSHKIVSEITYCMAFEGKHFGKSYRAYCDKCEKMVYGFVSADGKLIIPWHL